MINYGDSTSSVMIQNSIGTYSSSNHGGFMKVSSNNVTLIGCIFTENKAVNSGGVLSV